MSFTTERAQKIEQYWLSMPIALQAWAIIIFCWVIIDPFLAIWLWFLPDLLLLLLFIVGILGIVVLLIRALTSLVRRRENSRIFLVRTSFVLLVLVIVYGTSLVIKQSELIIRTLRYEGIVTYVTQNRMTDDEMRVLAKKHGFNWDTHNGVVVVIFSDGFGLIDNWCGVIYDPTDSVLKINDAEKWEEWGTEKYRDVRELFGGDILWTDHIRGHWYEACFT